MYWETSRRWKARLKGIFSCETRLFFLTEEKVETRVEEANHVSCALLQSAPPALNDPPTAQRTTPMAHQDNIVSKYKTKTTKQPTKEKRATIRETKTNRLSESMISVNDDCQGGELKQGKLRENETYPHVWVSFLRCLDAIAFYIQDSLLCCTGMH